MLQGKVAGVTGIVREPSQIETLDLALELHPGTKRLHVVAYAPAVAGFRERVEATLAPFSSRVAVTYSNEPTLAEMLAALKTLPADSLIFYVRYSPVTKGRVIFPDELLPEIAEAAPVPIYSALETNIGKGVVGGMMRSGVADAERLGEMALRILEGTPPESIPVEGARVRPIFDWRQLRRWGIDQARLPPGSDIRFRVPTVWELYGSYIMATVVVVIAQLLLIAGLLRQRARLRSADNTIRASEASLRTSYDRIRQMAGRLINAQEAARADIARDLHDDVCQKLAYVAIGVNTLRTGTGNIADPETQQVFDDLDREMDNTFDGIRRLSHDLHPATLRLLGLAPALRAHCSEVAKRQGVEVEFSSRRGRRHRASRCGGVLLPHRAGIAAQRHRAWRRETPGGDARPLGRSARSRGGRRRPGLRRPRGAEQRQRRPRAGHHGGARQPGRRHHLDRQPAGPRHDGESARRRESAGG